LTRPKLEAAKLLAAKLEVVMNRDDSHMTVYSTLFYSHTEVMTLQ